ncbi:MAG: hypothetical protein HQM00_00985 [Magnetococcales bacterium]|nr:hypothetical protein [Magnetococcales bacterium]
MITQREEFTIRSLAGLKIRKVSMTERNANDPYRSMEIHFDDGTWMEICDSGGYMRVSGIRNSTSVLSLETSVE